MKYKLTLLFLAIFPFLHAQPLKSFSVPPRTTTGTAILSYNINSLNIPEGTGFKLIEKMSRRSVPFQKQNEKIYWKIDARQASQFLEYEIVKDEKPEESTNAFEFRHEKGLLSMYKNGTEVIGYQTEVMPVPDGVDPSYSRSGFIHPLNTLSGKRLTRVQPKDHYHHYGIWNPWTLVEYDGDTLDFWNLNQKKGTVRFAGLIHKVSGPVFSEYQVLHEHVVLNKGKNEVALNETQTVRLYPLDEKSYLADLTFTYNCPTEKPFNILEYRYAGLGWRTTEEWDNQNSFVLTSEGKSRKDSDGSTARWCIVQGKLGDGQGGVVMLSHPQNYNHPEPLRIWPENQYRRGDMFANFAPTKNKDWRMQPGKTYTLKYRLLVFDGEMTAEKAEAAWQSFAKPIEISIN
jgi:hypothetical protein